MQNVIIAPAMHCTGAAVIFAQFKSINQFTAIGWFNVAYGLASLILLIVMFRGEMEWKKVRVDQCLRCPKTSGTSAKSCGGIGLLPLFISFLYSRTHTHTHTHILNTLKRAENNQMYIAICYRPFSKR